MLKLTMVILVLLLLSTGCNPTSLGKDATKPIQEFTAELPTEIANLPSINMSSVDKFQEYKEFADETNALIKDLK